MSLLYGTEEGLFPFEGEGSAEGVFNDWKNWSGKANICQEMLPSSVAGVLKG